MTRAQLYAANLQAALDENQMSRQQLVRELAGLRVQVSEQAVGTWLRGECAPRPAHQAAIARVLRIPAHLLFPVTLELAS